MQRAPLYLTLVNLLLLAAFAAYYFLGSERKIVYVDSKQLINGYEGMVVARKEYQKKATQWKANVDTLASEVQRRIVDFEKGASKMSVKERELTKELIRTKQKQLYDYQEALSSQAKQEDNRLTGSVITEINAYLKTYGERHGYTIILAATEYGNLAYVDESLNITEEVLKGLNNQYKGK